MEPMEVLRVLIDMQRGIYAIHEAILGKSSHRYWVLEGGG
jgi:hypothetical protein